MDKDSDRQSQMVDMAIKGQIAFGLIITGAVLYDFFSSSSLFGASLAGGELSGQVSPILWGFSGLLLLLYAFIQNAFRHVDESKEMAFLKFWVRQIHRSREGSVMALSLVPSSLGEGTIVLSLIIYLMGGKAPLQFLPGIVLGLGEIILSVPDGKVRANLALLDEIVRSQDNRHRL